MSSPTAEDGRPARRRRLSAILQADLHGYVRLMEGAEDRTVGRLKSVRADVWQRAVETAGGRIVNIVADSVLAEFSSAVAAIAAAIDVQERMARFNDALDKKQRLMFRIGLHLGEVIVDETETIFGDAVNVAARIQLMAEPGGIAASRAIRDATHLQVDCAFVDGGKHHARHVNRPLQIYHVRTCESAAGPLARRAGVTIRRPVLWGSIAAASVLLAGGYLAFKAHPTASVSTAAVTLSADQLEQALAERRRADTLAAERRQLETQARQRAEAEAEAKRRADVDLENARQARQNAERELAHLKADIEARRQAESRRDDQAAVIAQRAIEEAAQRKAEAEAAALREAEVEASRKAAADATAKRQADQALAAATDRRKQAEADALAAAGKTAAAMPRPNDEAETAEKALRLEPADRRRLQAALTSLGFATRGDDGVFGPRSRETIARWQKARNQPPTGFLTRPQQHALLKEAATTLSKYDAQNKTEADVKVQTIATASVPAPDGPPSGSTDGLWRGIYECGRTGNFRPFALNLELHLKGGAGTWYPVNSSPTNDFTLGISVSIDGTNVLVTRRSVAGGGLSGGAIASATPLSGQLEGNSIRASNRACTMVLMRAPSLRGTGSRPA